MSQRFASKVVLVTGGGSGMGQAVAERVAGEGATVVIADRNKDQGDRVAAQLRERGATALYVPTDVTVEEDVANAVRVATDEFGRLDGAFNNVGAVMGFGPVPDSSTESWQADLAINLTSVYYGLKYQIPAIRQSGNGGAVINNASNLGVVGMAAVSGYVAAKHGVVGLTRAAALENAESGIRVNALVTGAVDTPLFRRTMGATDEGRQQIIDMLPVKRLAQPAEIAGFVAYLLSDEAGFITGGALAIDGGITAA
ncbi:MAG: SDR family NAD(P)-dependent oxidoreductase [Stackebrandtia sp.]